MSNGFIEMPQVQEALTQRKTFAAGKTRVVFTGW
jgi:hypothetical protein